MLIPLHPLCDPFVEIGSSWKNVGCIDGVSINVAKSGDCNLSQHTGNSYFAKEHNL
jgi:hypothetical protein